MLSYPHLDKRCSRHTDPRRLCIDLLEHLFRNIHIDALNGMIEFDRVKVHVFHHILTSIESLVKFFSRYFLLFFRFAHDMPFLLQFDFFSPK